MPSNAPGTACSARRYRRRRRGKPGADRASGPGAQGSTCSRPKVSDAGAPDRGAHQHSLPHDAASLAVFEEAAQDFGPLAGQRPKRVLASGKADGELVQSQSCRLSVSPRHGQPVRKPATNCSGAGYCWPQAFIDGKQSDHSCGMCTVWKPGALMPHPARRRWRPRPGRSA